MFFPELRIYTFLEFNYNHFFFFLYYYFQRCFLFSSFSAHDLLVVIYVPPIVGIHRTLFFIFFCIFSFMPPIPPAIYPTVYRRFALVSRRDLPCVSETDAMERMANPVEQFYFLYTYRLSENP